MPDIINYVSVVLTVGILIGGIIAVRSGYFRVNNQVQQQTIDALKTRLDTLEKQAESDTKELGRLRQIIATIRHALKRRGLIIEIEGEFVTLIDADGARSTQVPPVAKVRPVKLQPVDPQDDDTAS